MCAFFFSVFCCGLLLCLLLCPLLVPSILYIAGEQFPDPNDPDQCKCPDERPKYVHQNQGKGLCCKQSEEYDAINHKCGFEPCPEKRPYRHPTTQECMCDPAGDRPHYIEGMCAKCDIKGGPKVRYIPEGAEVTHSECTTKKISQPSPFTNKAPVVKATAFLETKNNDDLASGGSCACPFDYPHDVDGACIHCCTDRHARTKFVPDVLGELGGPGRCHCENENDHVINMENGQGMCGVCPTPTNDHSSKSRFVPLKEGDTTFGTCECEIEYPNGKRAKHCRATFFVHFL